MTKINFQEHFLETLHHFTDDSAWIAVLWNEIVLHYSEPQRLYHNLHHLDSLIAGLQDAKSQIQHWHAVVLAVAFHDVIYDVSKTDNEEQSAEFAANRLVEIVSEETLSQVRELILATKRHVESESNDINYFTDADLSILGSAPATYREYCNNIRAEYCIYPNELYIPGRRKVVEHFLQMDPIFKTVEFNNKYELTAKHNLEAELNTLNMPLGGAD